jgi:hypothetical protein
MTKATWWLMVVFLMIAAVACRPRSGGQPVEYPAGWPMPEVTAPEGSWRAIIETLPIERSEPLHHGYTIDGVLIGENRNYAVGFYYSGSWDDAVKHVEECLEGIPYRITDVTETNTTSSIEYNIPSRQLSIQLYRQRIKSQYHYHLRAIVY